MKGTIKGIMLRNFAGIPEVRHPGLGTDARDSGLGTGDTHTHTHTIITYTRLFYKNGENVSEPEYS